MRLEKVGRLQSRLLLVYLLTSGCVSSYCGWGSRDEVCKVIVRSGDVSAVDGKLGSFKEIGINTDKQLASLRLCGNLMCPVAGWRVVRSDKEFAEWLDGCSSMNSEALFGASYRCGQLEQNNNKLEDIDMDLAADE